MMAPNTLPYAYTCLTSELTNINEETLTAVYGNHMSGKSNADVEYLNIRNVSILTFFPNGIENFFPNLTAIQIYHCNISTLTGHELDVFPNLTWFALQGQSQLERIPGNLFTNTPMLHSLWFYYNNIKHVGENLLTSLSQLTYAHFGSNYCVNQAA